MLIRPPWRRPDAWWVPRSSKPVRGLIGPCGFDSRPPPPPPLASTGSIEPLQTRRPDIAFPRNGHRDNRPCRYRGRVRWCRPESGQAEGACNRSLDIPTPSSSGTKARVARSSSMRTCCPELSPGGVDRRRTIGDPGFVGRREDRQRSWPVGERRLPRTSATLRDPASGCDELADVYRVDGAFGTVATATMLVEGGHGPVSRRQVTFGPRRLHRRKCSTSTSR